MKLTQALWRQNIKFHLRNHWQVQGRKIPPESVAFKVLAEKNLPIYDPKDILKEERNFEIVKPIGLIPETVKRDKTHPNWHDRACLTYGDNAVLLEGIQQAKSLTKTVEIQQGLPESIKLKPNSRELDNRVKRIIYTSQLLDSQQVKLTKLKDPERPSWNYPRSYGISNKRRNELIIAKLLQLIESLSGPQLTKHRSILNGLEFCFPFEKHNELVQFVLSGDTVLTTSQPLKPVTTSNGTDVQLPVLHPVKDTITLKPEYIYEHRNIYPISKNINKSHPHTIFVTYDPTEVKNMYEEEVTEDQIKSRSLLKAFTVASSYAKQQFGDEIGDLPKPVTVQCVQSDGRFFDFGVFQLNTLDLTTTEGVKNIWFQTSERLPLFSSCTYVKGKPVLEGYNAEVIGHLIALYNNV